MRIWPRIYDHLSACLYQTWMQRNHICVYAVDFPIQFTQGHIGTYAGKRIKMKVARVRMLYIQNSKMRQLIQINYKFYFTCFKGVYHIVLKV